MEFDKDKILHQNEEYWYVIRNKTTGMYFDGSHRWMNTWTDDVMKAFTIREEPENLITKIVSLMEEEIELVRIEGSLIIKFAS